MIYMTNYFMSTVTETMKKAFARKLVSAITKGDE